MEHGKTVKEKIEELKNSDEWFEKTKYKTDVDSTYSINYNVTAPFTDAFGETIKLRAIQTINMGNYEIIDLKGVMFSDEFQKIMSYQEISKIVLKHASHYGTDCWDKHSHARPQLIFDFDDKKKTREAFRRILLVILETEFEVLANGQGDSNDKRSY